MNRITAFRTYKLSLGLIWSVIAVTPIAFADDATEGEKLFALQIKPLFAEKCLACHGDDPDDLQGGLDLRTREETLAGGDEFEGGVLQPHHADESILVRVVARQEDGYEMPPKESEALSAEQVNWIRRWVDAGAPWPDERRVAEIEASYAQGEVVPGIGGLNESWAKRRYEPKHLWAYRPLNVPELPGDRHPIDWFINQRLAHVDLEAAPSAEAISLIRRMHFGLTGLPPQPTDVKAFVADYRADPDQAVEKLAATLMQSPHYGEHFARQWLDVARYADTAGFANDYARPNAWRYRDYVVRAFNDDKPYDQFVREQIAGDELDASKSENLVATGFLRMGPWEQTGMSVFQVTRQQWLDDVVDSVGQTFLAHPLQCAKCHDHKFDPIPTRDYYSMMAVFSTTQFAERDAAFLPQESQEGFEEATDWANAKVQAYKKQRDELNAQVKQRRKQETKPAKTGDNGLSPGDEASLARMGKNISRHQWELDKSRPIAFSAFTGKTVKRSNVSSRLQMPKKPWAKGELHEDVIYTGGDVFSIGEAVSPSPIRAAEILGEMPQSKFSSGHGTRRLDLANWITDPANPLTARVIVNRVWSWHFGQGIAGNPNNFGATGAPPSHPDLLDYLANWFTDNASSIKALNRLIVTSLAYRRSSQHPNANQLSEKDPGGKLYAVFQPRRLTAEEMRDAMLACSGELNRQIGGIPCRPDVNMEVAMQPRQIMGGTASVYEPDPKPHQRNRRSIYAERIRGLRDPFFESFNQPGFDKSCELRDTSTVAPQALTLLNAEEVHDRAVALAAKLMKNERTDAKVIETAFQILYGRLPNKRERTVCLERWREATQAETGIRPTVREYPSEVTRTVMAEKTGEPYDFVEVMPAYRDYVPDLQRHEVDAKTRGLSHVCLALLNSNEFVYVD